MRSIYIIIFLLSCCFVFGQTGAGGNVFRLYKSGDLPADMGRHGSCVIGKRLYIIAGEDNVGRRQKNFSAEIQSDGRLGPWREEVPLPEKRAGLQNALAVAANRIYIVGGMGQPGKGAKSGPNRLDSVLWTEVNAEGQLGQWQNAGPCPSKKRAGYVVCTDEKFLFVHGGKNKQPVDDMMSAVINADGSLSEWKPAGKLPLPLADHGSVIMDGRMYVWGGRTVGSLNRNLKVFSSPVSGGLVSNWREETSLPMMAYETVCLGYNDYLLAIGGRDQNSQPTTEIRQARLEQTQVKTWSGVRTDLAGQLFMSAAIDRNRGWVFVSGGKMRVNSGAVPLTEDDMNDEGAGTGTRKSAAEYTYVRPVQAFRLVQPTESRLNIGRDDNAGANANAGAMGTNVMNLPSLAGALKTAAASNRRVFLLLYSPEVPGCKRFWDAVARSPELAKIQQAAVLAAIDVSSDTEVLQKYGVYRIPAVVLLDANGATLRAKSGMQTMADVNEVLQAR